MTIGFQMVDTGGLAAPFDFDAKTQIRTPTESYARKYPKIVELANQQFEEKLWFASEMVVELDKINLKYELAPHRLHAIRTVLQLFLKYELIVGEEFWMGKVIKVFPRPEIKLAASIVCAMELGVHAEFYNKINIELGIDTDEDYVAYKNDPELAERMDYLESVLSGEDEVLSVIIFSLTETSLLFSSFSILKSFQCNGYNDIPVIARGANQSAVDEDLHGVISAEIINTYYQELGRPLSEDTRRVAEIRKAVDYVYKHECRIIDMAIPGGELNGQSVEDYKAFVRYRLNVWCRRIGLEDHFEDDETPIKDWFEMNTYAYKMIDFFTPGMGMEYESGWPEEELAKAWEEDDV
jgi:ribonucleotide reductase beta subunit family protein with ferritin-like domain